MKIEHQIISLKKFAGDFFLESQSAALAEAGEQGWELIQVVITADDIWLYCKRQGVDTPAKVRQGRAR